MTTVNRYAIGISMLVMFAWGAPRAAAATKDERQVTWEGLSAIVGQKVRIVMPDGAQIEARAVAVEVDALVVDIRKTSNKAAYPKGKFLVPRATLKAVDVDHPTGKWRVVGVAVGGAVGATFGLLAVTAGSLHVGAGAAGFGIGAAAMPVAGYFIGRAADRHAITYVIAQ